MYPKCQIWLCNLKTLLLVRSIESSLTFAASEKLLDNLLQVYPKNVTVLRAYGNFLETIKQDKDGAEVMYAEADGYEEENTKVYDMKKDFSINSPMPDVQEKYMAPEENISEISRSQSMVGEKTLDKFPESAFDMQSRTSASTRQHGS